MQLARISVRLHRKQRFGPLLVQPDILAVIFPFQQPLYIGTQLIDTHQGFYDLLCFLFKVGHLFIVSGLHGLDLLLQLPDALILVGNYPLQICNLFFIPRGLGVVEQRSDPFYGFRRGIHGHAFEFVGLDLPPRLCQLRFGFLQFFFLLPPLFVDNVAVCLRGSLLCLECGNIYRERLLLFFQILDLFGHFIFPDEHLAVILLRGNMFCFRSLDAALQSVFGHRFGIGGLIGFEFVPCHHIVGT